MEQFDQLPTKTVHLDNFSEDVNKFIEIVNSTYSSEIKKDVELVSKNEIIKDVLFFKYTKKLFSKKEFKKDKFFTNKILINEQFYFKIKGVLLNSLDISESEKNKLIDDFNMLETLGLNAFIPYEKFNDKIKHSLENKLSYMISKKYNIKHIITKDCYEDSIFSIANGTCSLHTGVKMLIEIFNISIFMSYDAFLAIDDKYTDVKVFYSNKVIKKIYVLSHEDEINTDLDSLKFLSIIGTVVLKSVGEFIGKNIVKNVELVLFVSNSLKLFPKKGDYLTDLNVNSGDTTLFVTPLVRIYRNEEIVKVLIHEIIHCSGVDRLYGNCFQNMFNVESSKKNKINLKFNETITETLAEFLNCVLFCHIAKENTLNCYKKELLFGLLQTAKILNHFGFDSVDDFLTTDKNNKKIIQKTAAFEYHILKTALMLRINDFIHLIKNGLHNDSSCAKMMKIIVEEMHRNEYKHLVNDFIKTIDNLNPKLRATFRMTVNEIKTYQKGGGSHKNNYFKYRKKYLDLKNSLRNC